jgi:hypothetical protein
MKKLQLFRVWAVIMPFLKQPKNYARVVGAILFMIGLFGFAFRSDDSLPDLYLGGALILGFWGILSGIWATQTSQNSSESKTPEEVED